MSKQKFIELEELCNSIHADDIRTAKKWCRNKKIPILQLGRKKVTYRFLVQVELDKPIINFFKEKYPENWEELYQHYLNNDHYLYNLHNEEEKKEDGTSSSEVKPKSQLAKMFAKS